MEFDKLISERYSCKKYCGKPVEADRLQRVLEAGRLAPTAKNLQEQHIYVAQSEKALAAVDAVTPCRYGAPTVLIVAFDSKNVYTYPDGKRESGIEDAAIVATHLMLAAANEGLGSCWVNCFYPDKLKELLSLPENEEILMLLDVGYPDAEGKPLPNHFSRKPLSETVTYI